MSSAIPMLPCGIKLSTVDLYQHEGSEKINGMFENLRKWISKFTYRNMY